MPVMSIMGISNQVSQGFCPGLGFAKTAIYCETKQDMKLKHQLISNDVSGYWSKIIDMFHRVSDVAFLFCQRPDAVLNTSALQGCRGPLPDYALHRKGLPRWEPVRRDHEIWVLPSGKHRKSY
jgi:hypothetical protein